jgi:lambda family phage tail tape measure protein
MIIGSLSVKLGLVTVDWDSATEKAKRQAKDLEKSFKDLTGELKNIASAFTSFGGVLSTSALSFGALMSATLSYANEVKDLAEAYDLSIEKTVQFRNALQTSGGSAEKSGQMLSKLFGLIGQGQEGTEKTIALFDKVGLTFEELRTLKPEEILKRVATGISEINNQAQKSRVIKEFFGKGGATLVMEDFAKAVNLSTEENKKQAESIKRFGEVSDNLKVTMDNLKIAFAELFAPFLGEGLINVEKFKTILVTMASAVVISNITKLATVIIELTIALRNGAVVAGALSLSIGNIITPLAILSSYFIADNYFSDPIKKLNDQLKETEESLKKIKEGSWWNFFAPKSGSAAEKQTIAEIEKLKKQIQTEKDKNKVSESPVKVEDEKSVEIATRESDAMAARIELQAKMLNITKEINRLKLDEINNDKYSIQQQIIKQNYYADIAKAEAARKEALAKPDKSPREIGLIGGQYSAAVAEAEEKRASAVAILTANRDKEVSNTIRQVILSKEMAKLDQEGYKIKLNSLNTGAYETQILEAQLATKKQIKTIEDESAQKMMSVSDPAQVEAETLRVMNEIAKARESGKANIDYINAAREKEVSLIRQQISFSKELQTFDIKRLGLEEQRYYMTVYEYEKQSEILNTQRRLVELEQQKADIVSRQGKGEILDVELERLNNQISLEKELAVVRMRGVDAAERQRTSFSEGWDKAFRDYSENAKNYGKIGESAFNSVTSNMESAIDRFVKTGKLGFKSFAQSVIQDLIAIQIKMQASRLLSMAFGAFSGGSAATGQFGVGAGVSSGLGLQSGGGLGLVPRASGGSVSANDSYMVGENGPEMFVPRQSGTIVPNGQLSSMGNQPQVIYNGPYIASMSAIDTQSAAQFLAKNKNSVWSANQSAARGLPTNR